MNKKKSHLLFQRLASRLSYSNFPPSLPPQCILLAPCPAELLLWNSLSFVPQANPVLEVLELHNISFYERQLNKNYLLRSHLGCSPNKDLQNLISFPSHIPFSIWFAILGTVSFADFAATVQTLNCTGCPRKNTLIKFLD